MQTVWTHIRLILATCSTLRLRCLNRSYAWGRTHSYPRLCVRQESFLNLLGSKRAAPLLIFFFNVGYLLVTFNVGWLVVTNIFPLCWHLVLLSLRPKCLLWWYSNSSTGSSGVGDRLRVLCRLRTLDPFPRAEGGESSLPARWIPYFATGELLRLDRHQTWAAPGLTGSFGPRGPISVWDGIFCLLMQFITSIMMIKNSDQTRQKSQVISQAFE